MAVEVVTVSCAGECVRVRAVATGGNAPYRFSWNDGVGTDERDICASVDTTFSVRVDDTPVIRDEFSYDGQTTSASVMANVLECPPDGGVPGGLCLENLSFEGPPGHSGFNPAGYPADGTQFAAPPWVACAPQFAYVWDETVALGLQPVPSPEPADGETYAALFTCLPPYCIDVFNGPIENAVSQPLCAALNAGSQVALTLALAKHAAGDDSVSVESEQSNLEIWGGNDACDEAELLWSSPPLQTAWTQHCATLTPTRDFTHLILKARGLGDETGDTLVFVDELQIVSACP